MAMNIAKLQAQLQHVPDQSLIGYVQNPDGQVPSYLALAELTRRKEIRKAGPTGGQPQEKKPSIAQQAVQEAQPDAGVAGLQLPEDMYSEKTMAAGGIVAFEGGGGVGTVKELTKAEWDMLPLPQKLAYQGRNKQELYRSDAIKYPSPAVSLDLNNLTGSAVNSLYGPKPISTEPALREPAPRDTGFRPYAPNANPVEIAERQAALLKQKYNIDTEAPGAGKPSPVPSGGITTGYSDLKYKPFSIDERGYADLMPKDQSMRDYASEFRTELGDDPNRAALREKIAGMQAKATKEEASAPWMALARAGLGMAAGKSPFALQNIASGGIEGIKEYSEAKAKMLQAEERRFELESRVAQAERAEKLASINYGADSKRADDQSRRVIGLQKQADTARAKEVNAKGEYQSIVDKHQFDQKDREIDLMNKRIDKQIASAETQGKRYELQNQRDALKALLQRSSEQLKTILPDPKNPEYVNALNEYNKYATQLESLANQSYDGWGKPQVIKSK